MTDYSKVPDYEINAIVGESLGMTAHFIEHDGRVKFRGENGRIQGTKDYCNNPADAWPIIKENAISLCAYRRENPEMNAVSWLGADSFCKNMTRDDNPLRAAMIVFLMMKDAEKC
ncbi:phage protein NinX family protein [Serratia sp. IR-2025]